MSVAERFSAFFAEANDGAQPYPWQYELVEGIGATGRWPDIVAPTGAGKSAVIDVHVFLVAERAAGRLGVRPPRRLVLVAPRRVLVDDQFDRAGRLAQLLARASAEDTDSPLGSAAAALASLTTSTAAEAQPPPLLVWSVRGGVLLDNGWRLDPAACQIICATPQMWGSRLLLRGYRASRASRNLESGLLGHDAVAIIDEGHLHPRLVETAHAVAASARGSLGLQVVSMSATQAPASGQLGVTERDLDDASFARRVNAPKAVELVEADGWGRAFERAIFERSREAAGEGTVGVFVNDVPTALAVARSLSEDGHVVELVCGRMRPADVTRLRARRPGLLSLVGDPEVEFLVSTQSLEVGVDLDLPAMVTAVAPASALAQRAGRLNRLGRLTTSLLTVVTPKGNGRNGRRFQPGQGPYTAEELEAALDWLGRLGGSISPLQVATSDLPLPPRPPLPRLRSVDLRTLAMTSDVQAADPDPDFYIQDPEEALPEIGVIARRHLDLDPVVIRAALLACPPRTHEVASLRPGRTLERVLEAVREQAWVVRSENGTLIALETADPAVERIPVPGDTLVVPHGSLICTVGIVGLGEQRGNPGPLEDVLEETPSGAARDLIVPLPGGELAPLVREDPILGTRGARNVLAEILARHGEESLAERMRRHRRLSELELSWCANEETAGAGLLVVRDMRIRAEEVPLAVPREPVTVDAHQADVEQRMARVLEALDLGPLETGLERLLLAARTHDEGKRHPRFQSRMGATDLALAKPRPGHVPDRGDGWRHEQLSAAYAASVSGGDPLVVALVAAHHGRGRPLFDRGASDLLDGWQDCPPTVVEWVERLYGSMGEYELLRATSERAHGAHRLAWLEALLRCADMQISREGH